MKELNGRNCVAIRKDGITYFGIHAWVRKRKLKPKFCESCNTIPPYDLANISGEYKKDVSDYEWLCRRCHMKKDGRLDVYSKPDKEWRLSQCI